MTDRLAFRRTALNIAAPLFVAVAFVGLWYVLSVTVYADKAFLLPGPVAVIKAMHRDFGTILAATLVTFKEAFSGYAAATLLGISAAALMSQSRLLERSFYPYAVLMQTVPVVAVAPLIVLWFGYGETSVIIVSAIISLFPIINNTLLGLQSASSSLVELFAMHKAGRLTAFRKLRLPGAVPNIIAGLRISAGLSVVGAIVGEFLIGSGNSRGGLGVQIIFAQGRMDTPLLFAEVIFATFLGFGFFIAVSLVGRLLIGHWHESAR
ncbi:ABC transporter permease subunit [bacterium]|nr:ABC transporter permease subunit [bacterium]